MSTNVYVALMIDERCGKCSIFLGVRRVSRSDRYLHILQDHVQPELRMPRPVLEGSRSWGIELKARVGGRGAQEVWRAWNDERKIAVVAKVTRSRDPRDHASLQSEARVTSRLRDAGAPGVLGFGTTADGQTCLVLEWIEGVSLRPAIELGRLPGCGSAAGPTVRALRLLALAARRVHGAHRLNLVHQDLKPEHVLGGIDGRAYVIDWGLAAPAGSLPPPGRCMGTLPYTSPEQARGAPASSAADVFSLGVIAFELVTGRRLYPAGAPPLLLEQAREGPDPETLGALFTAGETSLAEAISCALVTDPRSRAISAGGLADAIEETIRKRDWLAPTRRSSGRAA